MRAAWIIGVGMVPFGKHADRSIKSLSAEAVRGALADAGLEADALGAVWFANSAWGVAGGQDCIRGQVALRPAGIEAVPIVNVENACAGGATALHGAWLGVASGAHEVALAIGVEKVFQPARLKVFASFLGGLDVEQLPALVEEARRLAAELPPPAPGPGRPRRERLRPGAWLRQARALPGTLRDLLVVADRYRIDLGAVLRQAIAAGRAAGAAARSGLHSPFMDAYAIAARRHMRAHGSTREQLAVIAAKNHEHGALNPLAQIRLRMSPAEVLGDRPISYPLTRAMCAPIGDGAAAAIVCSSRFAQQLGASRAVRLRAVALCSGSADRDARLGIGVRAARRAYELGAVGPEAIDLGEVHDATAFGELSQTEALGFCGLGEGGVLAESGATRLGGRLPINPSGGLECRGHPIAASGLAQIHELVTQLRGEAGARQVERARIALAQNGGGMLGGEEAAMAVSVLEAPARRGGRP